MGINVSKDLIAFLFRVTDSKINEGTIIHWNVENYLVKNKASHSRRLESSSLIFSKSY